MNRQCNVPNRPSVSQGAAPEYKQQPARVPTEFMEAMKRILVNPADTSNIRTADMAAKTLPAKKHAASAAKWKSSFKPVGEEDDDPEDKSKNSSEKVELYDPYDPGSSDSELEVAQSKDHNPSTFNEDKNMGCRRLSPVRSRWDTSYSAPESRPFSRRNFSPETSPSESRGPTSCHRLSEVYSPDTESLDRPGLGPISRPLEHRVCSPDRTAHSSSTQLFPASYRGQHTNGEERITVTEHRREITTTVRLSPPKLQRDYQHQLGHMETGVGKIAAATEASRKRRRTTITDNNHVTCDLCDVELANGQELEDHLDSRKHWGTLEHIQQNNGYDDLAIAFLQEVMLYKSRQCSRAIEDSALQALQENDHMTKVEMFHCAACNVLVSTSAASVQTHITSQDHLFNTKEFEVQQRHMCLSTAETIMKELKPQFEHFKKVS
ncbi:hypothetical protein INR49_013972 [Caranx melampygus]|nr:hypothetical protein INR49_013972 [Caranx melampygus]